MPILDQIFLSGNKYEDLPILLLIGEGVKWHRFIWDCDMLPPKLMHILGCLDFSDFFYGKKVTLARSNHILKIQWEIQFFERNFLLDKTLYKKFRIVII